MSQYPSLPFLMCLRPYPGVCIYIVVYRDSSNIYSGLNWLMIIWTGRVVSVGLHTLWDVVSEKPAPMGFVPDVSK